MPDTDLVDRVEMLSHAVREGRCLQRPVLDHPSAPLSVNGHMLFTLHYRGSPCVVWSDAGVFHDEFRRQMPAWQKAAENCSARNEFLLYKDQKVERIMSLPDAELLRREWLRRARNRGETRSSVPSRQGTRGDKAHRARLTENRSQGTILPASPRTCLCQAAGRAGFSLPELRVSGE